MAMSTNGAPYSRIYGMVKNKKIITQDHNSNQIAYSFTPPGFLLVHSQFSIWVAALRSTP
jgi:hypothetical protein